MSQLQIIFLVGGLGVGDPPNGVREVPILLHLITFVGFVRRERTLTKAKKKHLVSYNNEFALYYLQRILSTSSRKRVCVHLVAESCANYWVL